MTRARFGALLLGAIVAGGAVADDVWIKQEAVVRAEQSPAGAVVVKLLKGAKVQQLEQQGAWVKVSIDGKEGWVSAASISKRVVKADSGLMGGNTLAQTSSAAAAKGLEPLAMQFAQNQRLSDAGLTKMEQIKKSVTPKMLADFIAEGHLGKQVK